MISKDILYYLISPTLKEIGLSSQAAEILVYGTAQVETSFQYLVQIGNPPNGGKGLYQDEDSDYLDLSKWLILKENADLLDKVLTSCRYHSLPLDAAILISNLKLATICCRLHYYRIAKPLPAADDAEGMAKYHKTYYNSSLGKADVDKNIKIFQQVINGYI